MYEIKLKNNKTFTCDKNSTIFDQFVTDTMNDFEQFSVKKKETDTKN